MKALFKLILLLLFILILTPFALAWLSLSDTPLVTTQPRLQAEDIRRAKQILSSHDPRSQTPGTSKLLRLQQNDINLAANYLLQKLGQGGAQISLASQQMDFSLSLLLPKNPLGSYANLSFTVDLPGQGIKLKTLLLGKTEIPVLPAQALVAMGNQALQAYEPWRLFQDTLQSIKASDRQLLLTYRLMENWQQVAKNQLKQFSQPERVRSYQLAIADLSAGPQDFSRIVSGLFQKARESSSVNTESAANENRALLHALGGWALGQSSIAESPRRLPPFRLHLQGRKDLAQHFLVSAAMASSGDSLLSNLIGTAKEIDDSDGGSGFSFADLAADRAGTLLGKTAVADKQSARFTQDYLSNFKTPSQLMPSISGLPAPMTQNQFIKRYGNTSDKRYLGVVSRIDNLIQGTDFITKSTLLLTDSTNFAR